MHRKTYIGGFILWIANLASLYISYKGGEFYWVFLTNIFATVGSLMFGNIKTLANALRYKEETGGNIYINKFHMFYLPQLIMSFIFYGIGYILYLYV